MTFKQLQDGTLFGRFKEAQRNPYIMLWLNTRMARVWTAFEWAFRIVEPTPIDTVAGLRYLGDASAPGNKLPADFGEMRMVYNDYGDELLELEERDFNARYMPGRLSGARGKPEAFTVVNRKIIVGPLPDRIYTFELGYKRLMCHDNGGVATVGVMVADGDKPLWPEEHHEVLVVGAQALGLKLVNDAGWFSLEQQHDDLVMGMVNDGLLHDTLSRPRSYGADPL